MGLLGNVQMPYPNVNVAFIMGVPGPWAGGILTRGATNDQKRPCYGGPLGIIKSNSIGFTTAYGNKIMFIAGQKHGRG